MPLWILTCPFGRRCRRRCRVFVIFSFVFLLTQNYFANVLVQTHSGNTWHYNKENTCDSLESYTLHDGYNFVAAVTSHTRTESGINLQDCLRLCSQYRQCRAVNFDGVVCQLIEGTSTGVRQLFRLDGPLRSFGICAEKICITDKHRKCSGRPWALEHVPDHHLSYSGDQHTQHLDFFLRKEVANVQSITACGQLCLDEESFACRSALYNGTVCQLSNMNRHTLDGLTATDRTETSTPRLKFKATEAADGAGVKVHYLENKCTSEEPRKFCDFRQLINLSLKTVDSLQSSVDSLGECRELCLAAIECRSYLYDATLRVCRLSHLTELSTWHINQPYEEIEGVSTYEISTCYNVSILCEPKSMKVQIETSKLFSGRIYSKSQPKQCVNDVSNQMDFHLSLPYIDADEETMRGKRCDTRQNFPGSFANDIIIQHNDKVLTSKDLSLGVYCKFDLQNDSIARIDLRIQGEILTDKLKGAAELPDLSLHVVDYHGRDIDEVTIGDLLRVQIRMSNEETYGIFVRNLVAKDSSNKTNNITLIDNKGCPVEMKMMREVRTLDKSSKSLESYLEAFTFTGGSLLLIEAEVETCLDKCRPMQCQVATGRSEDHLEIVTSYGRRRRRRRSFASDGEQAERGDVLSMTMLTKSLVILPRHDELSSTSSQMSDFYNRALSRPTDQSLPPPQPPLRKTASIGSSQRSSQKSSHFEKLRDRNKAAQHAGVHKKSTDTAVAMHMSSTEKDLICFEPLNLLLICTISFCVQALVFSAIFFVLLRSRSMFISPSSSSSLYSQPQLVSSSSSRLYPPAQQYSFMH